MITPNSSPNAPMRWLIVAFTVLMILIGIRTHSPGLMGFCIVAGLAGLVATALAFADARIQEQARSQTLNSYELAKLRREVKTAQDESTPKA
jgi:alpha-D-ribose 1-methylphosphonate 5-triphosphate synthase subunit PhnG